MEAQQQASEVVEGVIANICEKLGSEAKEHICLDKLRKSAKFYAESSITVPEAIEVISLPLQQVIQGKLEERNIGIKKIEDYLMNASKDIIVKQIRENLEQESEKIIVKQIRENLELESKHFEGASSLKKNDSVPPGPYVAAQQETINGEDLPNLLVSNASTSNCVDRSLPQLGRNKTDSDYDVDHNGDDDDEVVILSPEPRPSPPLIVLTDDSCEGMSSTSSDGVSLVKWPETQEDPKPNTSLAEQDTEEVDAITDITTKPNLTKDNDLSDSSENSGSTSEDLVNLQEGEITMDERISEIENDEESNTDNTVDGEVKATETGAERNDRLDFDELQQLWSPEAVEEVDDHHVHQAHHSPLMPHDIQPQSPSSPAGHPDIHQAHHSPLMPDNIQPQSPSSSAGHPDIHQPRHSPLVPHNTQPQSPISLTVDRDIPQAHHSILVPDNIQHHSPNCAVNTDINGNSKSAERLGEAMNFLMTVQRPQGIQSNELWEDAQYVCSLLPCFAVREVYQTMVSNIGHPSRLAFVLGLYINTAVDRQESVQDHVFQGLWEARKRSHGEITDPHTQVLKKRKTEQPGNAAPDEVLPSTSKAGTAPVMVQAPKVATDNNPGTSGSKIDPVRDRWYKEKMDFLSAVVQVDKELLWAQVLSCETDADIEALTERIMEEQDQANNPVAAPVIPQPIEKKPDINAIQYAAVAGPSNATGSSDNNGSSEAVAGPSIEEAGEVEEQGGQAVDVEEKIIQHVKKLTELLEDADPDYLQERCVAISGDDTKFVEVVNDLIGRKDYPKIEEYHKRQKRLEIRRKFIEGMSVEEFLEYFEDPEKVFSDTTTKMSQTYIENARTQLQKDLPYHLSRDIENTLKQNTYHYLPTLRALQDNDKLARRKTKRTSNLKEREIDDIFIKELCYVQMQEKIKEHLWMKEEERRRAFIMAKATKELQECGCCCDDEVLKRDMEPCDSPDTVQHRFCVTCIRRFVEEEIGQGRTSFRCLEGECKAEFSLPVLKKVMKPSIFSKILERKQQEEIAAAGIEDLVACPFCNFQNIMPNPEDKVFKCLNEECMKDSCRYCKEPNHVPLHCDEVEKQHQKDTRVFLENKMTEAMVRECWKCKKRFIKEDGCNKMVCSCGAMMCYICKQPIKGYDHFDANHNNRNPQKCPLWSNSKLIHAEEVRAAATKLQKELDPKVDLRHNPLQDLPEVPKNLTKQQRGGQQAHHHVPIAHQQQQVQAHHAAINHNRQPHHHNLHHNHVYHLPVIPPPAHLPPAPPAHRHFPVQIRVMRPPPPAMDMPEPNQYHHQHHHHHIHPVGQDAPPVRLQPTQPNWADILREMRNNEFNHELLRDQLGQMAVDRVYRANQWQ